MRWLDITSSGPSPCILHNIDVFTPWLSLQCQEQIDFTTPGQWQRGFIPRVLHQSQAEGAGAGLGDSPEKSCAAGKGGHGVVRSVRAHCHILLSGWEQWPSRPIFCSQTSHQTRLLRGKLCSGGNSAVPLLHFLAAGCGCKSQQVTSEVSQVLKETSPSPHYQEHCPPLAEASVLNRECGSPWSPQAPPQAAVHRDRQQGSPQENVTGNVTTYSVLRRHLPAVGASSQSPTAIPSPTRTDGERHTFPLQDKKESFNTTDWK